MKKLFLLLIAALTLASSSLYIRPLIFGHQKWSPPRYAMIVPPTMM